MSVANAIVINACYCILKYRIRRVELVVIYAYFSLVGASD